MFWATLDFYKLVQLLLPTFLRKPKLILFLSCIIRPLDRIYQETLYKMQHDGKTIYLEKMLNEYYKVVGYDPNNHDATKQIVIDDLPEIEKLYIFQDLEDNVSFLEDADSSSDVFLDNETEGVVNYSWIIYIPATIAYDEPTVRALVDSYRYFGKKYKIESVWI
jgi:hypothetical protein